MKTQFTLVTALLLGAAACGSDEPGRIVPDGTPVDVVFSTPTEAATLQTYPAEVTADRSADIATRMSGTVRTVHVALGQRVRAGDPLVSLDAVDVGARVEAARAAVQLAEVTHGRIERLAADGAASRQELDRTAAALAAARAALAEAQAQDAYAVVRASFAGVVTAKRVEAGDLANPGAPLLTLVDPTTLKITADLPSHLAGVVREGGTVEVQVTGVEGMRTALVTRVVPAVAGAARSFRIEAVPEGGLAGAYPGAYVRLGVPVEGAGTRWIPADAVVERGQLTGIFVVEDDVLRLRWVRLGARAAGAVELLSGPGGDVRMVRRPGSGLVDGTPVRSAREETWGLEASSGAEVTR